MLIKFYDEWKKCFFFLKCGWEMNWRNDPQPYWTMSPIVSYVHLQNFRCLQLDLNPWPMWCWCSALINWAMKRHRCKQIICWAHVFLWKGHMSPTLWVQIPLKTPEIFQVHIWDNRWDYPASVKIIIFFKPNFIVLKFFTHYYFW